MPAAHSKRAKLAARRARNAADRALALKLKVPAGIGIVQAAELAVEEQEERRERECRPRQVSKRTAQAWPCDTYHRRGEITPEHHRAAERLYGDYLTSGLNPWASSGDGIANHGEARTPGQGPTYVEYQAAMKAVGIRLSAVLSWVVLAGHHASEWALQRGMRKQDGIACLRFALDALGEHYRGERM
ncbi:MAG: hypothetical protein JNM26_16445 [Ideonella sp.]|nr:hypothetical protein [Ideonella sp.]